MRFGRISCIAQGVWNDPFAYIANSWSYLSLHWRHNEPDGVSNHQPRDCLLNCLFRCKSKKTSKLSVTGLCAENSPGTGEFSAQKASNAEMFSFDDVIMCVTCKGSVVACVRLIVYFPFIKPGWQFHMSISTVCSTNVTDFAFDLLNMCQWYFKCNIPFSSYLLSSTFL